MASYTQELVYGLRPIRRNRPRLGQSEWYYLDPRETDSLGNMKQIDVPDENSPNPYATEIKNYLAANDEHSFNELYNDKTQNNFNHKENTNTYEQNAIFNRVFDKTIREEGKYENRPTYIDTPTNMGIQQASLDRFKKAHPILAKNYPQNVKDITYPQIKLIAKTDYFDKYRIGEINSEALQETMFDSFYNHSPSAPAYWVQKAINQNTNYRIKEDGIFGSETINALNQLKADEISKVNNAILDFRFADFKQEAETNKNPNYQNFTRGLPRRFNKFRLP